MGQADHGTAAEKCTRLSNDLPISARNEQAVSTLTSRVFTSLLPGTIPGAVGAVSLLTPDALTPRWGSRSIQVSFMESVHTKSYSHFLHLVFHPARSTSVLLERENRVSAKEKRASFSLLRGGQSLKRKVASTLQVSFLFYSGYHHLPMYFSAHAKLTNTHKT